MNDARRALIVFYVLLLLMFALGLWAGRASAAEGPCTGYQWHRPKGVARMIRCVWPRFDVGHGGPAKALSVGRCESGLRWDAYGNGNGGVYQHRLVYWPGRYDSLIDGNPLRRSWGLSE